METHALQGSELDKGYLLLIILCRRGVANTPRKRNTKLGLEDTKL